MSAIRYSEKENLLVLLNIAERRVLDEDWMSAVFQLENAIENLMQLAQEQKKAL